MLLHSLCCFYFFIFLMCVFFSPSVCELHTWVGCCDLGLVSCLIVDMTEIQTPVGCVGNSQCGGQCWQVVVELGWVLEDSGSLQEKNIAVESWHCHTSRRTSMRLWFTGLLVPLVCFVLPAASQWWVRNSAEVLPSKWLFARQSNKQTSAIT